MSSKKSQVLESPIKGELFSVERLEEYAFFLGKELTLDQNPKKVKRLLPRMRENGNALLTSYRFLMKAVHNKEPISPGAEWLTDNFHIVEDQLREIKQDLPPSFYKQLPKIGIGELEGYPRIYAIALALIAHTDSQLEPETIRRYVASFQRSAPLKIGELWALSITLRLVLVENLRRISERMADDHHKRNLANEYADSLLGAVGNKPVFLAKIDRLPKYCTRSVQEDYAFLAEISKRLRDPEPELWPALEALQKLLTSKKYSTELVVDFSHQIQASNQITVANIITSMRLISSMNWRDFFESLSLVDRILENDPVYEQLDFLTRDRYRHVIENIGKKTNIAEIEIAKHAVALSDSGRTNRPVSIREGHVGYYLIGDGVALLEAEYGIRVRAGIVKFAISNANFVYFGLMFLFLACVIGVPLSYAQSLGTPGLTLLWIALLALVPCSELAINFVNLILTHVIRPFTLPKLDFSNGIPENGKTMVVVPCLLTSRGTTKELVEKLEIHYLGNPDPELTFALLGDFADAETETTPKDQIYVDHALAGIATLNEKYASAGSPVFFLFHRKRIHNSSEKIWMGWERKRGKINEFNRLLRNDQTTNFTVNLADPEMLARIRYVITLDADTQLPRDSAQRMIGTIMHPLNQAHFDKKVGRVTQGYGVLQPRIGVSLESSYRSTFAKIFSGYTGIDPYTTAVSEVYQDLFAEGSYAGKGLYDVDAFEAALEGRIPENAILSHDLFEGIFARAALLTDVELIDDYPQSYRTFFTRQHRWTRGDWQIGGWIFQKGLPLISRWKIFDNLRRSLVAPFMFLWFVLAFLALPGSPLFWAGYILFIIICPTIIQIILGAIGGTIEVNALQILLHLTFLAHQSYVQTDAIIRVFYRKFISKTKLMEWTTAAHAEKHSTKVTQTWFQSPWPTEIILIAILSGLIYFKPDHAWAGALLVALWMSYPLIASAISNRLVRTPTPMSKSDEEFLRQVARRTWNFFETFVGADDNYLPPDNHQESPSPVTAHRTSPTNIGLYMLGLLSAKDFGYVSNFQFIRRLRRTLDTLKKLEQFEGHFLNWYDTNTLAALQPRYVSTVDSGNLAGYLLATRQGCLQVPNLRLIDPKFLDGLRDTVLVIEREITDLKGAVLAPKSLTEFKTILETEPSDYFSDWSKKLSELFATAQILKADFAAQKTKLPDSSLEDLQTWSHSLYKQIRDAIQNLEIFAPWATAKFAEMDRSSLSPSLDALERNPKFKELPGMYHAAVQKLTAVNESSDFSDLIRALMQAKIAAETFLQETSETCYVLDKLFSEMNFSFLLDKNSSVFSIGYKVNEKKLDLGTYDLLASECRLASFLAIAKGDVTQEHWFRLGRQLVPLKNGRALISWTASMFEYLMPLLVMRDYENTLLDETMHSVVERQIAYGAEQNVPWGISEAGYHARDLQLNYQYGPFGIPGLGLKRGLSHDLVISPYSTVLAAMVNPSAAILNLKRFAKDSLLRQYGFYEAIDYTAARVPVNEKFSVIKSFMAHHQGMSLVSINNVIHDKVMQNRFHNDSRVQATRLLLQEKIPRNVVPVLPKAAEIELEKEEFPYTDSFIRTYGIPSGSAPLIQMLSNRHYSIMISTAGGGYSKCDSLAVSRWKEDVTRDNWGNFIFIKDVASKKIWSTTYLPNLTPPSSYDVTFGEDKVEFTRRDSEITTYTQILVAPEDNVEIRHVTLTNHSEEAKTIELTSYLEPIVAPLANDVAHPAFSKLFIQTEFLASKNALLARRRKRSDHERESLALHVVVSDCETTTDVQYETDRLQFIGRGRSLDNALAFSEGSNLSNTSGATLDPVLSLRIKVVVPANGKAQVAFTTGLASSREEALSLADRYHDIHSFDRESKLAWTKAQVDMRHLNVDSETAVLYQRLAERILYSDPSLRQPAHQLAANTNIQSSLWPAGISGDIPIVAVKVNNTKDLAVARKLLRCHEYLRLKGLVYDFVILNENKATYYQELQEEIQQLIRSTGSQEWLHKRGGIFVIRTDITPERDIANIQAVARILISADQPLEEQINRKTIEEKYPARLNVSASEKADPTIPTPLPELEFFNGTGGFGKNGREYTIHLTDGKWTPAPWINVVGNRLGFGFQISESGSGYTWAENSQTNRLTPWSNDAVSDPSGEIIYLRDDETGTIWSATPLPIRTSADYLIRHGQGYSIFEHTHLGISVKLTVFVPKDDLVKISLLELKNLSNRTRKISVVSYTEWVLGSQREKTAPHIVCDVDEASGAILARNPHDNEFSSKVAFADISSRDRTFTCSRKEFIGRNGSYAKPSALRRDGLSKKRGTGQDPCSVLQTSFDLKPNESHELSILLGQTSTEGEARILCERYRNLDTVKSALLSAIEDWNAMLTRIQVKTPDPAMDILMNQWLYYQTLSCRFWSRTAFYQSGGAYGFRDQLQDCMALVYSAPELTREQILRASEHQFKEGDVQHWWHPPSGRGVRTRMSDDLLWLPFVVSYYIKITGDTGILDEVTSFLEAPLLTAEQEDSYSAPEISKEKGTILEHCKRAIERAMPLGVHDLPLIGTGDWNDGMNRVGFHGKGESVWLGWFFYKVLSDFLPIIEISKEPELKTQYQTHMARLKAGLEKNAWDGDWYKRAYFDDGSALGSSTNLECRIDSIAQSWAVISGAGDPVRTERAMRKVEEFLIQKKSKLILLYTPPFNESKSDPGYIKGYVPGVRENGGQYTHAAIWVIMAYAELGDGDKAFELFEMLNPIQHARNEADANQYKVEPYVIAADVYGVAPHIGRGGWSWYTGSSSWYYRAGLESLLGFKLEKDKLRLDPSIPKSWKGYEISYRYGSTEYRIEVKNPKGLSRGQMNFELDGLTLKTSHLPLIDDGKPHQVIATLS
jgi:cyclic beta-1,2-glucan synthetase